VKVFLKGGPWDGETRDLPWDALTHLETPRGQAGVVFVHKYQRARRGAQTLKYKGKTGETGFISERTIKVGWW
jgi:hypothetical protein